MRTSGTFLRIWELDSPWTERVADVLGGGAVEEELEVLEHAAEVPAEQRHLGALKPAEVAPSDDDPALCRLDLLQQEPDDGRLPGAGGADDEHELALVDDERDALERPDAGLVDLLDALEDDHRGAARVRLDGLLLGSCSGSASAVIVESAGESSSTGEGEAAAGVVLRFVGRADCS